VHYVGNIVPFETEPEREKHHLEGQTIKVLFDGMSERGKEGGRQMSGS
jgi:hypothetical protein